MTRRATIKTVFGQMGFGQTGFSKGIVPAGLVVCAGLMSFSADALAAHSVEAGSLEKPLALEPGGYFIGAVGVADDEFTNISKALINPDSYRFDGESRVHFEGVSTLESGLRYGFSADIQVQNTLDMVTRETDPLRVINEAFVFVDGKYGRVELGQQDGVAGQFSVRAPHALDQMKAGGSASPDMADPIGLSAVSTVNDRSGDFSKFTYLTPSFKGLKLGLSFTPQHTLDPLAVGIDRDGLDRGANLGSGLVPSQTVSQTVNKTSDDIVEFGVIYSHDFEAISLDMSATFVTAEATPVSQDVEEWNAGVNVGFRGLTVGGSYRESDSATAGVQKYEAYDVGVAYQTGSWKVSAQFAEHEGARVGALYENGYRYLISARYKVAKGLRIGAGFQKDLDILTAEEDTAFILESALKF